MTDNTVNDDSKITFEKLSKTTKNHIILARKNGGTQNEILSQFNINKKTFNQIIEEEKASMSENTNSSNANNTNSAGGVTNVKENKPPRAKKSMKTDSSKLTDNNTNNTGNGGNTGNTNNNGNTNNSQRGRGSTQRGGKSNGGANSRSNVRNNRGVADPELSKMMKAKKAELEKAVAVDEKTINELQTKVKIAKAELKRIDAYLSQ